jgi:hypothetical protein
MQQDVVLTSKAQADGHMQGVALGHSPRDGVSETLLSATKTRHHWALTVNSM